jgi:hypothetical protein
LNASVTPRIGSRGAISTAWSTDFFMQRILPAPGAFLCGANLRNSLQPRR